MIETGQTKLSRNETLKESNPTLAGTIAATLEDVAAEKFSEDDAQFLKFHGVYQQDDRDKRKEGKQYILMVRGRIPGGVLTREQYLKFDELADRYGNGTLRISSRQGFQFHKVVKGGLRPLVKAINEAMLTTLAACGDVVRNVMSPPTPSTSAVTELLLEDARRLSQQLLPKTPAYHAIWLDGVQLDLNAPENKDFVDPLYGKTYLPRKFKIGFAMPPVNDVDIFADCIGFIAIADGEKLHGYNMTAGGGQGMSHGNAATYPRLADVVGFITREQVDSAARAAVEIHRDFGDRANRKHARLKYLIEERGVDWFRGEVERRTGWKFEPARPFRFTSQGDMFGWHRQYDGREFLCLFVETGRLCDRPGRRLKTALRTIVSQFECEIRLTPANNLILANVRPADREAITRILAEHGVPVENQASMARLGSMACVSLPTCGLGLAESERYLPSFMTELERVLDAAGLGGQEISIRMTGCPNGCSRPYLAEIGLVGKAPGKYNILLGGNATGTRLNRLYKENVKDSDLAAELAPLLNRYARERVEGERFGDWCARVIWPETNAAPWKS